MSSTARGAKCVAALVVGAVSAGAFAGVSHDGRGADPPEPIVDVPSPPVEPTQPATPATPDAAPTRAAVRSGGS